MIRQWGKSTFNDSLLEAAIRSGKRVLATSIYGSKIIYMKDGIRVEEPYLMPQDRIMKLEYFRRRAMLTPEATHEFWLFTLEVEKSL